MNARKIIEAETPKDFIQQGAPRHTLTVNDFCDPDDWFNALWALGVTPVPLSQEEAPRGLWTKVLHVHVGGDGYWLNRDLISDWDGLMRRWGENPDWDETPVELDKSGAESYEGA